MGWLTTDKTRGQQWDVTPEHRKSMGSYTVSVLWDGKKIMLPGAKELNEIKYERQRGETHSDRGSKKKEDLFN